MERIRRKGENESKQEEEEMKNVCVYFNTTLASTYIDGLAERVLQTSDWQYLITKLDKRKWTE